MKAVVLAVLELLILASPFLPWTQRFWQVDTGRALFDSVSVFIALQVVLLGVAWRFALQGSTKATASILHRMLDRLTGSGAVLIRDDEFYRDFLTAVRLAKSTVLVSYFAPTPPTHSSSQARQDYYREHAEVVRQKKDVRVRRLIRDTPANRAWAAELIREFRDLANCDLALVVDRPAADAASLALSVQVVDKEQAWLVALQSHERSSEFRDAHLTHPQLAAVVTIYFDRLWSLAEVILESGLVTVAGERMLKEVKRSGTH